MSASQFPAFSAIAFQLAAALETYEADVAVLVAAPFDVGVYQRVSGKMDEMRMYSAALPSLAVAWVDVMIRHFELTHGMWKKQNGDSAAADLVQLHRQLSEAVLRLSSKCVGMRPAT